MKIIVKSLNETKNLAENLAGKLTGNEIILLNGDLGAGKTTFTKFLACALGVDDVVTSPTFAFMKEYIGRFKISHYDLYRVEDECEVYELGITDNLFEEGLCIIEWNKFNDFPKNKMIIDIKIEKLDNDCRLFEICEVKI